MAAVTKLVGPDGKPCFRVRVYKNGRQFMGSGTTRRAAEKAAMAHMLAATAPKPEPDTERLETYMERWLANIERHNPAATGREYRYHFERHIKPALGAYPIGALKASVLQGWVHTLPTADKKRRCVKVLRACLTTAVDDDILPKNPCRNLKLPGPAERLTAFWTPAQVQAFWAVAREHSYRAYWALALAFPARPGELLALRWSDVNLDAGTVEIARSRSTYAGATVEQGTTKTGAPRLEHIGPQAGTVLRSWKSAQSGLHARLGRSWRGEDYVCTGPEGMPVSLLSLRDAFERLTTAAGLPRIRPYDLRATAVSNLKRAGASDRVVADLAGHRGTRSTMETYWRASTEEHAQAVADLEHSYFGGATEPVLAHS